jgi:hypothetical protein
LHLFLPELVNCAAVWLFHLASSRKIASCLATSLLRMHPSEGLIGCVEYARAALCIVNRAIIAELADSVERFADL